VRVATDRDAWLVLAHAVGVGPRTAGALVRAAGSARAAVRDPLGAARESGAFSGAVAARTAQAIANADARTVEALAAAARCAVLTPADDGYPDRVRVSSDPPAALFLRGTLPADAVPACALVGTRASTPYGERVARVLADGLVRAGVVVVSGLARGIDGIAHAATLSAGGTTVAVLGCGIDVVYPPEHGGLYEEIAARGAIVSELLPGAAPKPGHFLRRNRIVAALARAVVVVEAGVPSGALGTAAASRELGRPVLAVPGPIERRSEGCHRLLREGADVCEGVIDVLRALKLVGNAADGAARGDRADESSREEATAAYGGREAARLSLPGPPGVVLRVLEADEAKDGDELATTTGLSPDEVATALTTLEVAGLARRVPGVGFLRVR